MIAKGLTGKKFFARVVAAELACPRCGKVHVLGRHPGGGWEPRLSRWECQGCGLTRVVGVLLWPARETKRGWKGGKGPSVPIDAVPGAQEAQELSRIKAQGRDPKLRNLDVPGRRLVGGQANVDVVGEDEGEGG